MRHLFKINCQSNQAIEREGGRETARELQLLRMNHTESNIEYQNSAQGQLVEIPEKYNN